MVRFEWDNANLDHVHRHRVTTTEIAEVFRRPVTYIAAYNRGETRYAVVGRTDTGRYLTVFYTWRRDRLRVVTARDANPRERRRWRNR